jgi:chromosome partitioning protein
MKRRIIAIANQKGGVGKTTTSINLSSSLAHFNRRVLLIDMDPQANASRGLGLDSSILKNTIFDTFFNGADVNRVIKKTVMKNLDILPSSLVLSRMDVEVSKREDHTYFMLKNLLGHIKKSYDYIIIDCPPSLGMLSINALVAANNVLIPVQCEYFALDAVAQVLSTIKQIQAEYNQTLGIEGFLLTMFDSRTRLGIEISQEIRGLFKESTFLTQIPRNISVAEASAKGLPVNLFRPTSSGSQAYFNLAKEIIEHEQER